MRYFSGFLVLFTSFLFFSKSSEARPLLRFDDNSVMQQLVIPPKTQLVDEAIISLAQAASANILADVTSVSSDTSIGSYDERNYREINSNAFSYVAKYAAGQGGLKYERTDPRTLALWPQPDLAALVSLIVSFHKRFDTQYPQTDKDTTLASLQDFLSQKYGWPNNPRTLAEKQQRFQGIDEAIPLATLPDPLRDAVKAEFYHRVWKENLLVDYHLFEFSNWKTAHVRLIAAENTIRQPGRPARSIKNAPLMEVYFPGLNSQSFRIGFPQFAPQMRQGRNDFPAKLLLVAAQIPNVTPQLQSAEPATEIPQAAKIATVPQPATGVDLAAEITLQKPVKFSVKRVSLLAFLADLSKQSGVVLSLAPDVAPDAKITAHSPQMSLAQVMGALKRIYNAHWDKDANGYVLRLDGLDPLQRQIEQMGYSRFDGLEVYSYQERTEIGIQMANEVLGNLDLDELRPPQGVSFAQLPSDVQQRVFQLFQDNNVGALITSQRRLNDVLNQDISLRLKPILRETPRFFDTEPRVVLSNNADPLTFSAFTSDGRFITRIFTNFFLYKPDWSDKFDEKVQLQTEAEMARRAQE